MKIKDIIRNNYARVPFSVIGVFLILGSSMTTVYIAKLETEKTIELSDTVDFNEVENLLRLAEADMTTALNIAGLKGLKKIGEMPVFEAGSTVYGDTVKDVNKNLVREIIMDEMNVYLTGNYLYEMFNDGKYAVNILIPEGQSYPVYSCDMISFEELEMKLKRPMSIPFITPLGEVSHPSYYMAFIPVEVEIKKLETGKPSQFLTKRKIDVSCILTSRFLLLRNLVDKDYNKTINGINELWTFTTIIANLYTLIRGYQHYQNGDPENVVDNKHLALIVNAGLLFEQSFTFGSADPMALIQLVNNTYKTLKNKDSDLTDLINTDLSDPSGLQIVTSDFSNEVDITDPASVPEDTNDCPEINLSEIAQRPLYDWESAYVVLSKPDDTIKIEIFTPFTEEDVTQIINDYKSQGYKFEQLLQAKTKTNQTTVDKITEILQDVYTASIKTTVAHLSAPVISIGDHTGYPIDNGTSDWSLVSMALTQTFDKPDKGFITPGCTLYGEVYDLVFEREHTWSKKINDTWYEYTAIDIKTEDDVTLRVILSAYSQYKSSESDIIDVLYKNTVYNDINLEDTLNTYLYSFYFPNYVELLQKISGSYYNEKISGTVPSWVQDNAWLSLEEIYTQISEIKQDPALNSTNYPNTFELLQLIKTDLLQKYDNKLDDFLDKQRYADSDLFKSTGNKAVYYVRDWYVYKVRQDIENVFLQVENAINNQIDNLITQHVTDQGFSASDIKDTLSSEGMNFLQNQFFIPFGFDMDLSRYKNDELEWGETVKLAVDQSPDYLTPFKKTEFEGKTIQTMGLRNICTLGPTGLPILPPTPVTPWIITLNIWIIDVKGEYAEFKVVDSSDETIFNPIFGHDPQIYVRKEQDVYNLENTIKVGRNTRLKFGFTTVSFSVVPSWGFMVGDWGDYSEEDGWS